MKAPSITTKTGDNGETGLLGGERVPKDHPRVHAVGSVDELNAVIGVVLAEERMPETLRGRLEQIQRTLFEIGAALAFAPHDFADDVAVLERHAADLERSLSTLCHFILPGGSRAGSLLHFARTVCRRAERWVAALNGEDRAHPQILIYLNRLSDYLFLAARAVNRDAGVEEVEWKRFQ